MNEKMIRSMIERERHDLYYLAEEQGLQHEIVLRHSMQLDEWINQYYRLKNMRTKKPIV